MASKKRRVKDPDKKEETREEKKKQVGKSITPKLVVRVSGTDLDGSKPIARALRKIKGIGYNFSNAICLVAGINPQTVLSSLSENEIKKLEDIIKNPVQLGIPSFLVNRQRDLATGNDIHLTSSELDIVKKFDIQRHTNLKTYRGWRHMFGQPVRGQRTRSTFREKGRTVGVMKKSALQQKKK